MVKLCIVGLDGSLFSLLCVNAGMWLLERFPLDQSAQCSDQGEAVMNKIDDKYTAFVK